MEHSPELRRLDRPEAALRAVISRARCLLWEAEIEDCGAERLTWRLRVFDEAAAQRFLPLDTSGSSYEDAWHDCRVEGDGESADRYADRHVRLNRSYHQEFRCRDRSDEVHWLSEDVQVEALGPGRWYAVGVCTDMTEQRQLEEQLRHAQKMEAIGRLAGGIAHDFNNTVAVINGYGELLLDRLPEGDPSRHFVAQMVAAGNQAAALTRQLLIASRRATVAPRVLDLREVVGEMDRMLRRILGEDVQLTSYAEPGLGRVRADQSQLQQVLLNLAVNARDAMPDGGRLTLELRNVELDESYTDKHPEATPGPHVMLAVTDTGCGMSPEIQARAFEPFFTTKGDAGTGLGLATIYGIAKQSGGHVALYSEENVGTAFKVYLPRVDELREPHEAALAVRAGLRGTGAILLAEDEEAVRVLTALILREQGYEVTEATSGEEALRIAEAGGKQFDLLITDAVMGRISGPQLASRLRELQPTLKVLFLSGYPQDAVTRHGVLEPGSAFLQKPFSPVALARSVRDVLGEK
jgi:two-component system cell cycle sensor histidine kinase/response regulator CckA